LLEAALFGAWLALGAAKQCRSHITDPSVFRDRSSDSCSRDDDGYPANNRLLYFASESSSRFWPHRRDDKFGFSNAAAFRERYRVTIMMLVASCISRSEQQDAPHRLAPADAHL
jgi:hypothetical protein